jgi:hypothetical protein
MNDKWFNIGMIIILTSLVANGFVFMLTEFPNSTTYDGLYKADLGYASIKGSYAESVNTGANINTTATNYDGSGFIPILLGGVAAGLSGATLLIKAVFGLEVLLLTLANIFTIFATLIYTIIVVMVAVKVIVLAYLGSVLIRLIFGGRT